MPEGLKPLDQAALDALTLSSPEARAAYQEMRARLTGNRPTQPPPDDAAGGGTSQKTAQK